MKKQNRFAYLILITTLCLYEIVAFLTMYTHRFCDLWLYPCGLQYIIFCLIVPVITILLWLWKTALIKKSKGLKRLFSFAVLAIPFMLLAIYLFLRPIVLDFTIPENTKLTLQTLKESCIKEENRINDVIDYYDTEQKCSSLSLVIKNYIDGKIMTKTQFISYLTDTKQKLTNWPYNLTKSCEAIINYEFMYCLDKFQNKGRIWCDCFGNTTAFFIKKDKSLYTSNAQINKAMPTIRQQSIQYCDNQSKTYTFVSPQDYCSSNGLN